MQFFPLSILAIFTAMVFLPAVSAEDSLPVVVIKADDLRYHSDGSVFGEGWNRFIDQTSADQIKISVGIICDSLENGPADYFEAIKKLRDTGRVEFWNHGYTHFRDPKTKLTEFMGPDYETQLATISRSQELAERKLGFPFESFGAPYNATDANTVKALRQHPELSSWMYGDPEAELLPGQVMLGRSIDIEQPVHHPNFEAFSADFAKRPDLPYYVLQVHPGGWDETRLAEFGKIIDFLKSRNAIFLTPSELRDRLTSGALLGSGGNEG